MKYVFSLKYLPKEEYLDTAAKSPAWHCVVHSPNGLRKGRPLTSTLKMETGLKSGGGDGWRVNHPFVRWAIFPLARHISILLIETARTVRSQFGGYSLPRNNIAKYTT